MVNWFCFCLSGKCSVSVSVVNGFCYCFIGEWVLFLSQWWMGSVTHLGAIPLIYIDILCVWVDIGVSFPLWTWTFITNCNSLTASNTLPLGKISTWWTCVAIYFTVLTVTVSMSLFAAVNFICDNPDIRAISFVGSDTAVSFVLHIKVFPIWPWISIDLSKFQ